MIKIDLLELKEKGMLLLNSRMEPRVLLIIRHLSLKKKMAKILVRI